MKTHTIILILLAGSMNMLFANDSLFYGNEVKNPIINIRLNLEIIGTEHISAEVFSYDIVGLEADATATYLTNGVTLDINSLIADLTLNKDFVKIGIKLKWGKKSKYFLFDHTELRYGKIDMEGGKE